MLNPPTRRTLLPLAGVLALAVGAAACASGGGASEGGAGMASASPARGSDSGAAMGATSAPAATSSMASTGAPLLYTARQSERGEEIYDKVCGECHTRVEFHDDEFLFAWEGATVGRLYAYIRESMPDDAPGSLPPRDYVDVMAYILSLNGYGAGEVEMIDDAESLSAVKFESRRGATP